MFFSRCFFTPHISADELVKMSEQIELFIALEDKKQNVL